MKDYEYKADILFRARLDSIPQWDGWDLIREYMERDGKLLLLDMGIELSGLAKQYCKEKNCTYEEIAVMQAYNAKLLSHYFEFVRERMHLA